jgi:hypothetical protein
VNQCYCSLSLSLSATASAGWSDVLQLLESDLDFDRPTHNTQSTLFAPNSERFGLRGYEPVLMDIGAPLSFQSSPWLAFLFMREAHTMKLPILILNFEIKSRQIL